MSYLIMEYMGENEYNGVRYRIGIEHDYEIKDGEIEFVGEPKIHYREVMGIFIYLQGIKTLNHPEIDKKVVEFREVLSKLINDEEFNRKVYNHFFVEMEGYPEDVFEGIYYEFN